ncbi:MAG: hypothetical protein N2444_08020, partial [Methylocystis sp.]|nr:hypothetical protein [Methylocystis sp.]
IRDRRQCAHHVDRTLTRFGRVERTDRGVERVARIRSISLSGVAIESALWPPINSMVQIGAREAVVVRHFDDGFACEFVRHFEPGELDEMVRL